MAWLTVDGIRGKFSIQSNAHESQIDAALLSAGLIIQRSVDSDVYAEAIGAAPTDPEELLRYSSVVESHAYLTMWFLAGNVGNKLASEGFLKQAQDAGSPAMNSQIFTNQWLTPKDLEELKADLLGKAKWYLGEYGTITIDVETRSAVTMASLTWFN